MNRNTAMAGCGGNSITDRGEPEVSRSIGELMCEIDRYENLAMRLQDRVCSVVVPESPQQTASKQVDGYQVPLAQTLHEIRCKVNRINDAMESLYQRIEL